MTYSPSQRRALIIKNDFSPFGNKVIESGYVNNEQMQQALSESRKFKKPDTGFRIAYWATIATGITQAVQETTAV